MDVTLSYSLWVRMQLDDMMTYIKLHSNVSQVVQDRIASIATTSNIRHLLHNDKDVRDLCEFMEKVISRYVREKVVGSYRDVSVDCDELHVQPFNCFFPFEVGLTRNVITKVNFNTNEALNRFKLSDPKRYNHLVKNGM